MEQLGPQGIELLRSCPQLPQRISPRLSSRRHRRCKRRLGRPTLFITIDCKDQVAALAEGHRLLFPLRRACFVDPVGGFALLLRSQTNRAAIVSCDTTSRLRDRSRRRLKSIRTRRSQYLNNRIEQDHRSIKRRVRPMLGFKSADSARTILGGIEMIAMMRKRQARYAFNPRPSLAEQFDILAA